MGLFQMHALKALFHLHCHEPPCSPWDFFHLFYCCIHSDSQCKAPYRPGIVSYGIVWYRMVSYRWYQETS